ncbi:fluoride efflux transporter CrcB [Microbaculum sp. FT89]|uniref:fluoride efflux transporter CrcB n=1 Tax=Microbaculum sp. FT89 TaxID=3447298 RepID=UPI003F53425C
MPVHLAHLLIVAGGGAIGAGGRHLVNQMALKLLGPSFPWGTLIVNIVGSFAMGLLIGGLVKWMPVGGGQGIRLFLATGILGGFTTFSAFSLDVAVLWQRGATMTAFGYVAGSVLLSILAVFLGLWVMRGLEP